jgi:hypothetical protein
MIFLYEPSIDASGRLLDCLARGIPVCVPEQATEWASIAKNWGRAHLFDWTSQNGLEKIFDHPSFSSPRFLGEPPFTPEGTISELLSMTETNIIGQKKLSLIKKVVTLILLLVHGIIAATLSTLYSILFKIKSSINFRNR